MTKQRSKHSLAGVLHSLIKKQDFRIITDRTGRTRYQINTDQEKRKNDLGNGSQGKIDFLRKRVTLEYVNF